MSHFALNIMHFSRVLRAAGVPISAAQASLAATALTHIDIGQRRNVHHALRATLIHTQSDFAIFDSAFEIFWRQPGSFDEDQAPEYTTDTTPGARRLADAFARRREAAAHMPEPEDEAERTRYDSTEILGQLDFASMSAAQIAAAKTAIATLKKQSDTLPTRRWHAARTGRRIDFPATIRAALRTGGEVTNFVHKRQIRRPAPLVLLCDISGSMARYSEIMLHFAHALAQDRARVSVFLFGTRLTNITRAMRLRDPDHALAQVRSLVPDWSGGTRIGEAITNFNRLWARRSLGQGARVLLLTDGLDRDGADGLETAMARLHASCRRLIWLNPLLSYEAFEPRTEGAKAMLPHVDEFRPVHNLASLSSLVSALKSPHISRTNHAGVANG